VIENDIPFCLKQLKLLKAADISTPSVEEHGLNRQTIKIDKMIGVLIYKIFLYLLNF